MLFKKGDRVPRFCPTCPNCGHEVCGHCSSVFQDIAPRRRGDIWRQQIIGEKCCGCGHQWDERQFDIIATEDVP